MNNTRTNTNTSKNSFEVYNVEAIPCITSFRKFCTDPVPGLINTLKIVKIVIQNMVAPNAANTSLA